MRTARLPMDCFVASLLAMTAAGPALLQIVIASKAKQSTVQPPPPHTTVVLLANRSRLGEMAAIGGRDETALRLDHGH